MSDKKFSIPRGTSDILPEEASLWQNIETKARDLLKVYNYKEIRTPIFEEVGLFARSMGQTSDVVQKQMLTLEKNTREGEKGESSKAFALRPEGTASIVRSYIENNLDKKESLSKLFYIGSMFRGERPQKGRLRQFSQIGVEVIGPDTSSPYLDAEVIGLSVELLKVFGIQNYVLKINSLGTPQDKDNFSKLLKERLKDKKASLCENCQERFDRNVFRVLDCKSRECQSVISEVNFKYAYLSEDSQKYYEKVKQILSQAGIKYKEDTNLVRGLDYYTQVVFEITSPDLGSQDALGAGGRYNQLVEQLGGSKGVNAVGFSLGIERILLACKKDNLANGENLDVYCIALDQSLFDKAFELLRDFRVKGIKSDINYRSGSMKSQMRSADKSGARYVVILGSDEINRGVVSLKDMQTGEQVEEKIDQLTNVVKEKLC